MNARDSLTQRLSPSAIRTEEERSPFARLNDLLAGPEPALPPIRMSVGEPQHAVPDFVGPVLARHIAAFGRYPSSKGTDIFLEAAASWIGRRQALPRPLDPKLDVLSLNGSREGLFFAAVAAARWLPPKPRPVMLLPNPFYAAYSAGAVAAGCEPVFLPTTLETGFLPDLDALSPELLARTVGFYIASPANPQGAIASPAYLTKLVGLARRYNFLVFSDECYSELYNAAPPASALTVAGPDYQNVVIFQSLSKRSNLPGLRVGFAAGDRKFLQFFLELRNVAAPQVPEPLQHVAAAAFADEAHVDANRALYQAKFARAAQIIGNRFGFYTPDGGFYLWLDVAAQGGEEEVTLRLWREAGVRVVPGSYLARTQADGSNPGKNYIRVAMVSDKETTETALRRIVEVLG